MYGKRLLHRHGDEPKKIVTDKLRSYGAGHRELTPGAIHNTTQYANNRAEQFAYHAQLKAALGADNFFAHPYSSWKRGLNENNNGLIRQYLPKGMALAKATSKEIKVIQNKLNNITYLPTYLPSELEEQFHRFVSHYNHNRYHEPIDNLTPADVYYGRGDAILNLRKRIKLSTIALRRNNHYDQQRSNNLMN